MAQQEQAAAQKVVTTARSAQTLLAEAAVHPALPVGSSVRDLTRHQELEEHLAQLSESRGTREASEESVTVFYPVLSVLVWLEASVVEVCCLP